MDTEMDPGCEGNSTKTRSNALDYERNRVTSAVHDNLPLKI